MSSFRPVTTLSHRASCVDHTVRSHPGDNSVDHGEIPLLRVRGTTGRVALPACGQRGTTSAAPGSVPRRRRRPQAVSTAPVDDDTRSDLRRRASSPVCTPPMTTTTEVEGGVIPEPGRTDLLWTTGPWAPLGRSRSSGPSRPRCARETLDLPARDTGPTRGDGSGAAPWPGSRAHWAALARGAVHAPSSVRGNMTLRHPAVMPTARSSHRLDRSDPT